MKIERTDRLLRPFCRTFSMRRFKSRPKRAGRLRYFDPFTIRHDELVPIFSKKCRYAYARLFFRKLKPSAFRPAISRPTFHKLAPLVE